YSSAASLPYYSHKLVRSESSSATIFFFKAADRIRSPLVTRVQTCALPISPEPPGPARVLIDAPRSWRFERRPEWGGERFPPTVRPAPEDEARVRARWDELGLGDLA